MTLLVFSFWLFCFSILAGLLGALTGLGGGIIIIPVLALFFHIDIHYAMGAALISVIATSSGSTIAYLQKGYTNLRIGMFLETGAVIGAIIGALLMTIVPIRFLEILFSLILFFSAYLTLKRKKNYIPTLTSHPWAIALKLNGNYPVGNIRENYRVQNVPSALIIMGVAGVLAGLLGIGSGALKVLAMDQTLHLPYKVATTTSNFMIGITAAVSAGFYFSYGYINPIICFPVMIGVIIGAFLGAKLLTKTPNRTLRIIFSIAIFFIGLQMFYNALKVNS